MADAETSAVEVILVPHNIRS